jgi:hypothetical protein
METFKTNTVKGIKNWPEIERPRERLIRHGPDTLSDAQLLAILLRTGRKKSSAVEMANHLLKQFGGLAALKQASVRPRLRRSWLRSNWDAGLWRSRSIWDCEPSPAGISITIITPCSGT